MQRIEDLVEDFEEFFVTYAAVENLLYKNFLVRVFHLKAKLSVKQEIGTYILEESVCMGVDGGVDRVKSLYYFD